MKFTSLTNFPLSLTQVLVSDLSFQHYPDSVVPIYRNYQKQPARSALNFGKQTVLLKFFNSKFDTYTIIKSV